MGAELDLVWNKVFQEDKNHQREESNQLAAGGQLIGAPVCPLTDTLTLMANAKLIFGVAAKPSLDDFSPPRCEAARTTADTQPTDAGASRVSRVLIFDHMCELSRRGCSSLRRTQENTDGRLRVASQLAVRSSSPRELFSKIEPAHFLCSMMAKLAAWSGG